MRYVVRNIRSMLKNEPFLSVVIIVCVFTSAWVMTFAYGIFRNFQIAAISEQLETTDVAPVINDGKTLTKGDYVRYITSLSDETAAAVDEFYTQTTIEDFFYDFVKGKEDEGYYQPLMIPLRVRVKNGKLSVPLYTKELWLNEGYLVSGRYFEEEEETEGRNVVIMKYDDPAHSIYSFRTPAWKKVSDGRLEVFGRTYEIIGEHNSYGELIIPLNNFPDDTVLDCVDIFFIENVTPKQYDELKSKAEEMLPGVLSFPELPFPDYETLLLYNNIILISCILAALTVIHFAALFVFILRKRERQLAVMLICGATKLKVFGIYMTECCCISLPVYIIGTAVYIPIMHGALADIFPFIEQAYSLKIYLVLFAIYALILIAVMSVILLNILKKETVGIWKGAKK